MDSTNSLKLLLDKLNKPKEECHVSWSSDKDLWKEIVSNIRTLNFKFISKNDIYFTINMYLKHIDKYVTLRINNKDPQLIKPLIEKDENQLSLNFDNVSSLDEYRCLSIYDNDFEMLKNVILHPHITCGTNLIEFLINLN